MNILWKIVSINSPHVINEEYVAEKFAVQMKQSVFGRPI